MTPLDMTLCSYYSSQSFLDAYENATLSLISHTLVLYFVYHAYDEILLVLGDNLIAQYFASNETRYRSWPVSVMALAALIDSTNIYIFFHNSMSVNVYDLKTNEIWNYRLLQHGTLAKSMSIRIKVLWKAVRLT